MLKHVAIRNFKSLDVDVRLEPVTVLVGRSGAGKTNFVDGMRFLRDLLREEKVDWKIARSATIRMAHEISFHVEFGVASDSKCYVYKLKYTKDGKFLAEHFEADGTTVFATERGKWLERPQMASPPEPSGIVLPKLTGVIEASIATRVLTTGWGCYNFSDQVMTPNDPATEKNGLSDSGNNFIEVFEKIISDLSRVSSRLDINKALHVLNPTVDNVDLSPAKQILASHRSNGQQFRLPIERESEGFRRFFAYLLAMYQTPPKQTIVFEEPEKGIHPGALEILVDEIKSCPEAGRGQVILTTHSPKLLDYFAPESIRVVEMTSFVTRIGSLEAGQFDAVKQHLLMPGELLTVDFARMDPVEAVHEP